MSSSASSSSKQWQSDPVQPLQVKDSVPQDTETIINSSKHNSSHKLDSKNIENSISNHSDNKIDNSQNSSNNSTKVYTNPFVIAYQSGNITNPNDDTAKNYVSPTLEPVDGKVKPPFLPPDDKPHRNTNQLQYLLKTIHKAVTKHKHAWPFDGPVDTKALKLPDYFAVIKKPMDLSTIKKRLENYWYYDAWECVDDYKTVFVNCYIYNKPTEDVVMMAKQVEQLFLDKLEELPVEEVVMEIPPKGKGKKKQGRVKTTINSISRTSSTNALPNNKISVINIDSTSNHSQMMESISPFSNSNQSTFQHYNQDSQSATSINHANNHNAQNLTASLDNNNKSSLLSEVHSSKISSLPETNNASTLANQSAHINNHADISNHSSSSNLPHDHTSPDRALTLKSLILPSNQQVSQSASLDQSRTRPSKMSTRRESGRPIKKPQRDLPEPQSNVVPLRPKKGRMTERMKACQAILRELLHRKNQDAAYPFYHPVDAEAMGLRDYHDIIKQPMDLSTIKKKMDAREYRKPENFASDVRLMLHNSFKYNPPEHDVNKCGRKLLEIFEQKFAKLPEGSDDTESDASDMPSSESESDSGADSEFESAVNFARQIQNSLKKISDDVNKLVEQVRSASSRKKSSKSKRTRKLRDSKRFSDQQDLNIPSVTNTANETYASNSGLGKGRMRGTTQKRPGPPKPYQTIKKMRPNNPKMGPKQGGNSRNAALYDSEEDDTEVAMSYDEKRQLSLDINKLPGKCTALGLISCRTQTNPWLFQTNPLFCKFLIY